MNVGIFQTPDFHGQQEGERVLYTIHPHPSRIIVRGIRALFIFALLVSTVQFFHDKTRFDPAYVQVVGWIISLMILVTLLWWTWVSTERSKTVITDRRLVRLEASFPWFITKRGLFWNEVAKVKAYSPNILFRFMNIGNIELRPLMAPIENIEVWYVYYFEDLANYIDKLLFVQKNEPEKLKDIRPFITKPKGHRY